MKYILTLFLLFLFTTTVEAQLGKRLRDKVKQTAEQKANQKADEAVNKGVDKVDSVITGKKREPKSKNSKTETETTPSISDNPNSSDNSEVNGVVETVYKEVVVKTNIRCEAGKKKLETILRDTDGVSSAMIDNDNGNLYLSPESPDVHTKVIELIRQNGFEADGKKPTKPLPNPCK